MRHRSAANRPNNCHRRRVIIDVRPTPALRRHRARIAGAVAGLAMVAATLVSVAELAGAADSVPAQVPYSDPVQR
jgi:hypothetical protein